MSKVTSLSFALLSSLLLWAAWPASPFTVLIFIAWVPLLWAEDQINNWKKLFLLLYLAMFCWNILTTWWIWNASLPGALGAFFANSLIMCIPWLLFHFTKKYTGRWIGYGSLIVYWLSFEWLHHNWELSWPWLTLGNVFATHPQWVQWYQYTGSAGGSLWVLLINIIVYAVIKEYRNYGRSKTYFASLVSLIFFLLAPIIISRIILSKEKEIAAKNYAAAKNNVVAVQPNIDPYTEKFTGSVESQIQKMIVLSEGQIDDNTTLVVWPETAIPVQAEEGNIKENRFYYPVWSFLQRHPRISLLSGIDSYKVYGTNKTDASSTARYDSASGIYFDFFNTAAFIEQDTTIQLYHKAKLVPGVETLPSFLGFMGQWFEDFGGISGTLGRDKERKVFVAWDQHYKAAPIICYESIYGDYITDYVRKGANVLTIITNDGWWGNTPGYKQHMNYARLRAIETRKWVVRSANTGISCFIDPLGNVINPRAWDTDAAIKNNIPAESRQTFFVRNGDLLSHSMPIVSLLIFLFMLFTIIHSFLQRN